MWSQTDYLIKYGRDKAYGDTQVLSDLISVVHIQLT